MFASEKDRSGVDSELHTNLLSGKGEYLALVGKMAVQ